MSLDHVYGIHAVAAALNREQAELLWVADNMQDKPRIRALIEQARQQAVPVRLANRVQLDGLAGYQRHQGVVLQCQPLPAEQVSRDDLLGWLEGQAQPVFVLVLDGLQDPHNLGACLRSADAAGVQAVVIPRDRAAGITATVRKVASGAAEQVALFQVTNLARTLRQLREAGVWLVGADANATRTVFEMDFSVPVAVVLGGEGKGLRRLTRELCDVLVSIPMAGNVASLNVSVATGVVLFEVVRQRQGKVSGTG